MKTYLTENSAKVTVIPASAIITDRTTNLEQEIRLLNKDTAILKKGLEWETKNRKRKQCMSGVRKRRR